MHAYTKLFQPMLAKTVHQVRVERRYTQATMAERLHIDTRSYCDLEHGHFCFSAPSLILLELMMTEMELRMFIHELQDFVQAFECV